MSNPVKAILSATTLLAFLSLHGPDIAAGPLPEPADEAPATNAESSDELLITLRAPLTSPLFAKTPVAVVDEEPITFSDLTRRIASIHEGTAEGTTLARKDYANLLERVITTKLIVQEARNIGFDELPEIRSQIDDFSTKMLASSLLSPQLETVSADPAEVDALYRKMSREVLLTALRFKKEADALAFRDEYQADGDFDRLAARFVEAGRAEGDLEREEYVKLKDLLPRIARAAFEMKPDSLSEIFSADGGFILFYLEDMRFYEDAALKEEARQKILAPLKQEKAAEYIDSLLEKHATIDRQLLRDVDFEKTTTGFLWQREVKPVDFQALLDDDRVLATVRGDEPFTVTVGELASAVKERRFHGVEEAAKKGKLNREKERVLRDLLFRRIVGIEAAEQGKDQAEEYLDALEEFTNGLLFETFVKKVIAPDVEISEGEARAYYAEHTDEFSSPAMFRMNGLAFYALPDAEKALMKLRRGADFQWVSANSPGQIDKEKEETLVIEDSVVSLTALPEALRTAAEKARPGDALLYNSPENHHYVISIEEVFPATRRPYEAVRRSIAKIIFDEKARALVDDWSGKLREAYDTRIFVTGIDD